MNMKRLDIAKYRIIVPKPVAKPYLGSKQPTEKEVLDYLSKLREHKEQYENNSNIEEDYKKDKRLTFGKMFDDFIELNKLTESEAEALYCAVNFSLRFYFADTPEEFASILYNNVEKLEELTKV